MKGNLMTNSLKNLSFVLFTSALLSACGGGGGGSSDSAPTAEPVVYDGLTTQSALTEESSQAFVDAALDNSTSGTTSGSVIGVTTESESQFPLNQTTTLFYNLSKKYAVSAQGTNLTGVVVGPETESCTQGGSITITIDVNQATGDFTGDIEFDNCREDGQTLEGAMEMSGQIDAATEQFSAPLNITVDNFTVTGTEIDTTMSGFIDCDFTYFYNSNVLVCRQNLDIRDNTQDETYRLVDFVTIAGSDAAGNALIMDGTFYHPDYGYVEIGTTEQMTIASNGNPESGTIVLTGADSSARITFVDSTEYMLEVDADNDTIYETNTLVAW